MFSITKAMRSGLVALLVSSITPQLAIAEFETLDEITVVADFRGRKAAELPPSISVLDRQTIEQQATQHFEELLYSLPNVNWSGDGHRARYLQIRGVGELEQYEGAPNPSVGFLIDDIDFSGIGTVATLFDVEQINVLRGPQGTRYGANALAGLVYVQSAEPTADADGRLQLSAGGDDALSAGLAVGGPLHGEQLGFRLSAQHYASNGFRVNSYLGRDDSNRRRETSVRGKLVWEASADLRLRFSAMFSDIDDGYDAFAIDNSLTVLSDKPGRDAQRSVGASLRTDWTAAEHFALTSITAIADSDIDFAFDGDWGNPDVWAPYTYDFITDSQRSRQTVSQEIRLTSTDAGRLFSDRADWLLGVYVMRLEDTLANLNQGDYVDPLLNFSLALDDLYTGNFEALSTALFGQVDLDISDSGVLTVGMRAERRATDYQDSFALALDPSESMLGFDLRYRHDISERSSAFAGLSKGYKAGGFNLGSVPSGRREFAQESLWSFEVGARTSWLNDALLLNAVAFLAKHEDQQVRTSFQLQANDPTSFVFFTDNAASGRTSGLEAELRYRPDETWEWYLSVGYLRAEFDEFVTPQVNLSGRDQAHAPRYTAAAGVVWRNPSGWFARLDATARDAFYFDVSHDQRSSAYQLINGRLGYEAERWSVQLWARNLLDESYAVRGFFFGNEPPDFPDALYIRQGDPRHAGITYDLRF